MGDRHSRRGGDAGDCCSDDDRSVQPGGQADRVRDADAREHDQEAATDPSRVVGRRQRHPGRSRLRHAQRRDRQGIVPAAGSLYQTWNSVTFCDPATQ